MSDLEQTAIERLKAASDMSLRLFEKPLVITYSGGKDSDVLLHLARASGIPFEVLHSLTTENGGIDIDTAESFEVAIVIIVTAQPFPGEIGCGEIVDMLVAHGEAPQG